MKFSILTVVKNNRESFQRAAESVRVQSFKNYEHIIVDGASTDGTLEFIKEFADDKTRWISEPDNGIYDAINKGIKMSSGDVIGLLHSDDFYANEDVLARYEVAFAQGAGQRAQDLLEAVYSDLVYVGRVQSSESGVELKEIGEPANRWLGEEFGKSSDFEVQGSESKQSTNQDNQASHTFNQSQMDYKIIRYWKAHTGFKDTDNRSLITDNLLRKGWMPPHPTLFVRKEIFDKYGLYRTDMKIAADYEMILRLFWKHKITSHYLPITTYCMTFGGASNKSLRNIFIKSSEDYRAMKMHSLPFPIKTLLMKNFSKLPQFFKS